MMAQRQTVPAARPLRADAERTMTAILEAAERILSRDPAATMEQVAEAAGVARTTVHRRFATREALIDALGLWVTQRLAAAVDAARPDAAPPLVALYEATANVLRVKASWSFAMSRASAANPEVARLHTGVRDACERLFRRAQQTGLLRADADLAWTQRVYYALLHEAASCDEADADAMATLVVDTLLRGAGTAQPGFGHLPVLPERGPRTGARLAAVPRSARFSWMARTRVLRSGTRRGRARSAGSWLVGLGPAPRRASPTWRPAIC